MKSRKEAAAYARRVFWHWFDDTVPQSEQIIPVPDKAAYHWGQCELTALMDFIYEGEPGDDEEIWPARNLRNR